MSELRGVGIGLGVAQGVVVRMTEALPAPENVPSAQGADAERMRVRDAVAAVAAELTARGEAAGGSAQEVLEAQAMIAEDPTLQDEVDARIDDGATAEWAVHDAFAGFRATLEAVGGYLGERAADLDDIAQRVLARLRGVDAPGVPDPGHPFVLVARDLAPADTALLNLEQVLALVTFDGGPTSHTAILAREKGIVAIVGAAAASDLATGSAVIVDAAAGLVTVDPTDDEKTRAEQRAAARRSADSAPLTPGALADGTLIPLLANLGKPADASDAVERGAEGVGLFRPECLF
ncbi:phosphoenolpyruvate--protein phosphotransferase, partial [Microbacterium sp. ISL-103]|uniref:phosphoenolpyruvate-utilizing N-terminal domain-containing protein n=1 Tax=Microbacterium sp. ISL-103 TaxID=2819156 RepID=UPI001C14C85A